jgi:hypothetical protein
MQENITDQASLFFENRIVKVSIVLCGLQVGIVVSNVTTCLENIDKVRVKMTFYIKLQKSSRLQRCPKLQTIPNFLKKI